MVGGRANRTESSILISSAPADVMAVIADFAAYPDWTGAVRAVEIRETGPDGRASEVWFDLESGAIKDQYALAYDWSGDASVRWHLVSAGSLLKAMDGAYLLANGGTGTTEVTYQLAVDVTIPMIGMMKRKAEKVIIDTALKELKKRVEG